MTRRWVAGAAAVMLAVGTVLLAVAALRPSTPPVAPTAPVGAGALAVVGDTTWRWVGPDECIADGVAVPLERRDGNGSWSEIAVPLANVYGITFSDNGEDGVAYGVSTSCSGQIAVTDDGGFTWHVDEDNPVLADASWAGKRVWGLDTSSGEVVIADFRLIQQGEPRLAAKGEAGPIPCDARDGVPSRVAFYTERVGLLLCEHQVLTSRLIARTVDAGATFERLTDGRPESGLDGGGPIEDLEVAGQTNVWALFPAGGECAEGQLRLSDSQGLTFTRLPCLSEEFGVDEILNVAFTSARHGTMLAVGGNTPLMLETRDAGKTWSTLP